MTSDDEQRLRVFDTGQSDRGNDKSSTFSLSWKQSEHEEPSRFSIQWKLIGIISVLLVTDRNNHRDTGSKSTLM